MPLLQSRFSSHYINGFNQFDSAQYRRVMTMLLAVLALISSRVYAHEFWLEPESFIAGSSSEMVVELRNGQHFSGEQLPFRPDRVKRFTLTDAQSTRDVRSQPGDLPAMTEYPRVDGLHIVRYESTPNFVTYTEFAEFKKFVEQEGLDWVLNAHTARKLSEQKIREVYSRYAKSLLRVGAGTGHDLALGMEFELIALSQPYQSNPGDNLEFELRYQGQPAPDIQVSVFQRDTDIRSTFRTDQRGRVRLPNASGGRYLVNAVMMRKPSTLRKLLTGADWESLWASLTFELPAVVASEVEGPQAHRSQLKPAVRARLPQPGQSALFQ